MVAGEARAQSVSQPAVQPVQDAGGPQREWDERFPFMVHVPIELSQGVPFGALDGGAASGFASNAGNFTAFGLGVGVRVNRWLVDLMLDFGFTGVQGAIANGISAAGYKPGTALRVFGGADLAYYIVRTPSWAPWVGLRLGYESLDFSGNQGSNDSFSVTYGSLYYAARAGIDWRIAPAFGLGLYAEAGLAMASSAWTTVSHTADPTNPSDYDSSHSSPYNMPGSAMHGLATLGVRTVFFP
jgi:hypothetical protein